MGRNPPILFARFGKTKTGRTLFKLCHAGGHVFGRAFCIDRKAELDRQRRADRKAGAP